MCDIDRVGRRATAGPLTPRRAPGSIPCTVCVVRRAVSWGQEFAAVAAEFASRIGAASSDAEDAIDALLRDEP